MKYPVTILTLLSISVGLFAQVPNMATMQSPAPEGTSLGANNTLSSSGIALGNRVKMRGFVDFRYDYSDLDGLATDENGLTIDDDARFRTAADVDFLFDFSPVTGEVHLAATSDELGLEQAFLRYNFNQDFSLTAGRQLTVLSYEKDESPNMYQTSYAYLTDVSVDVQGGTSALESFIGLNSFKSTASSIDSAMTGVPAYDSYAGTNQAVNPAGFPLPSFRRNYVDGIRANFNNGQFGLVAGLHNGYFTDNDNLNDGNIGLDIAASVMIIPGLELRLGFGYENNDDYDKSIAGYNTWATDLRTALTNAGLTAEASQVPLFPKSDDISQFNAWLSYQTGGLTLAMEWDMWDMYVIDMWNLMFLANYQFNDLFALTFRYSHEDFEADVQGGGEGDSNRFTIGPMFTITDFLTIGVEYSHAELDSTITGDTSVDELYAETIFSF